MDGPKIILRRAGILAAVLGFFGILGCLATASASAAPLLWTANSGEESLSTFDTGSNSVVGPSIGVGEGPDSIAITPDGRRAVVVNETGESVTVLEIATGKPVGTVSLGSPGERVAISPEGKVAYVTDESDERVYVISTETARQVGSFVVGPEAFLVAFAPSGTRAYVGTEKGVAVVETATEKVVGQPIELGGLPTGIVFTPDGKRAYATASGVDGILVIDPVLGQVIRKVPLLAEPTDLAMSPNGERLYASTESAETVTVVETASNEVVGTPLKVGKEPGEIALTPNGETAYVAVTGEGTVVPIATATRTLGNPIKLAAGKEVAALVVAPDQSPTAAFAPPPAVATFTSFFDGSASTDPDGTVASYEWAFGEGATASGPGVNHAYRLPGTYNAQLSVVDNEGCGEAEVFTGRTAYCSGNPLAKATHPVEVKAPPVVCSSKFGFGGMVHNRKNGTVRLQVRLHSTGFLLLFGKKVHAVTRKVKKAGSMFLTIHARVELNKRLKKIHRTSVRVRITFTPSAGCGFKTVHRSIALLRAPRKKHHH